MTAELTAVTFMPKPKLLTAKSQPHGLAGQPTNRPPGTYQAT